MKPINTTSRFNWQSRPLRPVDNVTKLPLDKKNLADKMPDKTNEVLEMMKPWREETKAPMPTPNVPSR